MKAKIIEFATEIDFINLPKPARSYIPEWYKKTEKFFGGKRKLNQLIGSTTVKGCVPFLDAFTTGYILELFQDVEVIKTTDSLSQFRWNSEPEPLEIRNQEINSSIPMSIEYTEQHFAWSLFFNFKTPKNYSFLITHPLNRFDLPFTTLSGIVDADNVISNGKLPFFLKKDFEGIIPKGTPIAQLLPFKRENWKAIENKKIIEVGKNHKFNSVISTGFYQKNLWKKKNFN